MALKGRLRQGRTPNLSFKFVRPTNTFNKTRKVKLPPVLISCDGIIDNVTTYVFEVTPSGKLAYVDCDYVV